ncbi:hypothetical protein ACFVVQ_20465 [Paenibacillus chitinolyticus]|uniref:hypothetical protein n=1 Tax=Paenibacillus chitinolyticus TaxID=79263 RepID=UPI0036DF3E99
MKKKIILISAFSFLCFFIGVVIFETKKSSDNNPEDVLVSYFYNMKEENIDKAILYVDDKRFKNSYELRSFYLNEFNRVNLIDFRIVNISKIDQANTIIEATFKLDDEGNIKDINNTFKLKKKNGKWKIYIDENS